MLGLQVLTKKKHNIRIPTIVIHEHSIMLTSGMETDPSDRAFMDLAMNTRDGWMGREGGRREGGRRGRERGREGGRRRHLDDMAAGTGVHSPHSYGGIRRRCDCFILHV